MAKKCLYIAIRREVCIQSYYCYVVILSHAKQDASGFGGFINTRGMKIVHQNVRGLFNNLLGLQELIERHRAVDILTVSETHIVDDRYDDNEHLYKIPGYVFINRNRKHGLGGGVAMYIKESIDWVRRDDLENDSIECIWLEVFVKIQKAFCLPRVTDLLTDPTIYHLT